MAADGYHRAAPAGSPPDRRPASPAPRQQGDRIPGYVEGNARLTASTAVVLIVLLAAEGVTVLRVGALLSLHVFLGAVVIPPVVVKVGSTSYRFVRYYVGDPGFRRKGPPALLLRLLGPVLVILTAVQLGTGVALMFGRQWRSSMLFLHKASFVLWFGAMTVHVLGHVVETGCGAGATGCDGRGATWPGPGYGAGSWPPAWWPASSWLPTWWDDSAGGRGGSRCAPREHSTRSLRRRLGRCPLRLERCVAQHSGATRTWHWAVDMATPRHLHVGAAERGAAHSPTTTCRPHHGVGDGQAEPRSRSLGCGPVETVEEVGPLRRWNARPAVTHGEGGTAARHVDGDLDMLPSPA